MSRSIRENQRIQLLEQQVKVLEDKLATRDRVIEAQAREINELRAAGEAKPAMRKTKKTVNGE